MNATNKTVLLVAFIVVIVLFLFFGSGAMTGATWGGGMMGNGMMGGISWMWIPTVIILGIGILLGWAIFGKNKLPDEWIAQTHHKPPAEGKHLQNNVRLPNTRLQPIPLPPLREGRRNQNCSKNKSEQFCSAGAGPR
jgi:hypothetical protein